MSKIQDVLDLRQNHNVIMSSNSISSAAQLAKDVSLGAYCVVGPGVSIGPGSQVGSHVVIHPDTIIGANVRIDDHAVIGKRPMRSRRSALPDSTEQPPAIIRDNCILGTGSIIYAGATIGDGVLVADLATIREDVEIGADTIIGRGVSVESHCTIGSRCKLETNAYITAYSVVEDDVFIAPGVLTSNDRFLGRTEARLTQFRGVHVRRGARMGVGAVILPGIELASESVAAAGSVITKSTQASTIYAGVPGRDFGSVPQEQLLDNHP